jgi:type I restriction enzyme M protein
MSSQASSAGHGEAEVRRKLVETGDVDVMVSIRSNFFYTRTVPCELWHFDKGKPDDRRDQVLMIDARNIYRKVTRKIYDFTPEQLANLTAIVWLYRGHTDRFLALVQSHLDRTIAEAAAIADYATAFHKAYTALDDATAPCLKNLPARTEGEEDNTPSLPDLLKERDEAAEACFHSLEKWTARIIGDWAKPCAPTLPEQHKRLNKLGALSTACRDLVRGIDLVCKLGARVVDAAEKQISKANGTEARDYAEWDRRTIGRLVKELDAERKEAIEQLKRTAYFERQGHWLLSRFPEAAFVAVPGLCRIVTRTDIQAADWSLTPGRYVGVAPPEVDEDFDFEQVLRDIHIELADLNQEATNLAAKIHANFEGLGI